MWLLSSFPRCGEATVVLQYPPGPARPYVAPGEGSDPERSRREASRRARSALRRFCTHHRCDRLATLTFADEPTQADGWREVERFRKRLERALGKRIPMAVALDFGDERGRLHFHVALPRYVDVAVLQRAWGLGFVDVRKIKAKGEGKREQCRRAASYLASYVAEETDRREAGRHRYSLTRGMEPEPRRTRYRDFGEAIDAALGLGLVVVWSSAGDPDWVAPPVYVLREAGGGDSPWISANTAGGSF